MRGRVGTSVPIVWQGRTTDTGLFPRARVLTAAGAEAAGSPISLTEIGGNFPGAYRGSWTIPAGAYFVVIVTVYTDAGFTQVSTLHDGTTIDIDVEDSTTAAELMGTAITGHPTVSVSQALSALFGFAARGNVRLDNFVYDANGFLTSVRARNFATAAAAQASTDGGSGQGEISTQTWTGLPDLVVSSRPRSILCLIP